jgi:hypothetical protein
VSAATTEQHLKASEIAQRHPNWVVWTSRPTATRAGNQTAPRGDGLFAVTVVADTWDDLDAKLTEQDENDADQATRTR